MQFPETATLIEARKPNAKGEGVIEVHSVGCAHQNRVQDDVLSEAVDPNSEWLDYGSGVEGAVAYFVALRSGMLDDGVVNFPWVPRLSPCAKKQVEA